MLCVFHSGNISVFAQFSCKKSYNKHDIRSLTILFIYLCVSFITLFCIESLNDEWMINENCMILEKKERQWSPSCECLMSQGLAFKCKFWKKYSVKKDSNTQFQQKFLQNSDSI